MVDDEPKWNSNDWDMPSGMDSQSENHWRYQRDLQRDLVNFHQNFGPSSDPGHYNRTSGTTVSFEGVAEGLGSVLGLLWRMLVFTFFAWLICTLGLAAFIGDWYLILHGWSPWT